MKVIVEAHVPYAGNTLDKVADVQFLEPEEITASAVRDADALIVRTRTRCDRELLDGSRVSFIGTATIGTDHIDLRYCRQASITVASAPGCNAPAVAQWVFASIAACHERRADRLVPFTRSKLGIIGVGHVGSIVDRWARQLGMDTMLCDPPRSRAEGNNSFCSLEQVLEQCDIITLHTPLTSEGEDATWHMINRDTLDTARRCKLLLNAARGAICDTRAMLEARDDLMFAIDCWEGEPTISTPLLQRATIATPHIAGYSIEGKQRGTAMVLDALARHFGVKITTAMPDAPAVGADRVTWQTITAGYDPMSDTVALKAAPNRFEQLRNGYALRHEVAAPPS